MPHRHLTRRAFLATAASGGALAALSACAASADGRWLIGHHFWNWDHAWNNAAHLDTRLRLTSETGYDGFEAKPAEIGVEPGELRDRCERFGVQCAAIGGGIEEAVEYAHAAGVSFVRAGVSRQDSARWVEYAGERGITIVIHPHVSAGNDPDAVETREDLLRYLDVRPGVHACPDTGHLLLCGSDPVQTILDLGERCRYLHLKDVLPHRVGTCQQQGEKFCELGTGALDVEGVLGALRTIGYTGWIMVERDSREADYVASARRMRSLLSEKLG
jgi:sugar phosphate isomerase/epimerase